MTGCIKRVKSYLRLWGCILVGHRADRKDFYDRNVSLLFFNVHTTRDFFLWCRWKSACGGGKKKKKKKRPKNETLPPPLFCFLFYFFNECKRFLSIVASWVWPFLSAVTKRRTIRTNFIKRPIMGLGREGGREGGSESTGRELQRLVAVMWSHYAIIGHIFKPSSSAFLFLPRPVGQVSPCARLLSQHPAKKKKTQNKR